MSAKQLTDLSQLCIHTITTKPWSIEEAAKIIQRRRKRNNSLAGCIGKQKYQTNRPILRDHGLNIVSLCRGGFFPTKEREKRKRQLMII